jgi:uncharacterized protein
VTGDSGSSRPGSASAGWYSRAVQLADAQLPPSVGEVLARYRELLRSRFGERLLELRLFGSFARGDARADSDVDVLVVIAGITELERDEAIDLAYAARADHEWVDLSPVVYSDVQVADLRSRERGLLRAIDSEGIAL